MRFQVKGHAIFGTYAKTLNGKIVIQDEETHEYIAYERSQLRRIHDKDY
jgi:hypothetical protein